MYRAKKNRKTRILVHVGDTSRSFGKSIPFDQIEKLDNRSF